MIFLVELNRSGSSYSYKCVFYTRIGQIWVKGRDQMRKLDIRLRLRLSDLWCEKFSVLHLWDCHSQANYRFLQTFLTRRINQTCLLLQCNSVKGKMLFWSFPLFYTVVRNMILMRTMRPNRLTRKRLDLTGTFSQFSRFPMIFYETETTMHFRLRLAQTVGWQ